MNTEAAIEQGKCEILEDITHGMVPGAVCSFADLHDFVDANEYGGDLSVADAIIVQAALDAWLVAGRP